jgi:flagellar L-ring protein precursor FlgH
MNKIQMIKTMKIIYIFLSLLLLNACSSIVPMDEKPDDPKYAPVPAQSLKPPPVTNGSLFQDHYAISLYSDQRARRIGDVITVVLQEQTNAQKSNSTNTTKDTEITMGAGPTSVFGSDVSFLQAGVVDERSFKGKGDSGQSNSLQGQITVTISDVLPNGILEVRGEKWLSLNEGDEFIRVQGLIRPQDIGADNTVQSTKLADARISYGGTGSVANASKPGWMSNFFNSPWWPF